MRYELVRVAQLVFTLAVMFGAFSAGLAAGWLHWGRAQRKDSAGPQSLEDVPRIVKPDLFSPAVVPAVRDAAGRLGSGVTSSLHPDQPCTEAQAGCRDRPDGGNPELSDDKLATVTFYTRTLAVPARRQVRQPATDRGEAVFARLGCASCHTPEQRSGPSEVTALSEQTFRPYTDLLLHDMGPALADDRPDRDASGSEWRTPPLWGVGLVPVVNDHTRYLHDGRARNLAEAVLWHGGEAEAAQRRFTELPAADRRALLDFLESL